MQTVLLRIVSGANRLGRTVLGRNDDGAQVCGYTQQLRLRTFHKTAFEVEIVTIFKKLSFSQKLKRFKMKKKRVYVLLSVVRKLLYIFSSSKLVQVIKGGFSTGDFLSLTTLETFARNILKNIACARPFQNALGNFLVQFGFMSNFFGRQQPYGHKTISATF